MRGAFGEEQQETTTSSTGDVGCDASRTAVMPSESNVGLGSTPLQHRQSFPAP